MPKILPSGATKILENIGIISYISFGTETEDVNALTNIAKVLDEEPKEYVELLRKELKSGNSFPKAREIAVKEYLGNDIKYENILNSPNNILAIEYMKNLKSLKSKIDILPIKREKTGYNDESIVEQFASASAIRRLICNKNFDELKQVVPKSCYDILAEEFELGNVIMSLKKFENEILYELRRMSIKDIANLPDVSEGLEYTIKNGVNSCNNLNDLINMIKSKRYTQTRIQRILICTLLGITKSDMDMSKEVVPYARVLGFNEKGKVLLSKINQNVGEAHLVTSVKKFVDNNKDEKISRMLEIDAFATDVYALKCKGEFKANMDFTKNMVKKCYNYS